MITVKHILFCCFVPDVCFRTRTENLRDEEENFIGQSCCHKLPIILTIFPHSAENKLTGDANRRLDK